MPSPEEILAYHHLPVVRPERSASGFTNEVYFCGAYVLKRYASPDGYAREKWFYEYANAPYAPELIACGEDYIILSRIEAKGVYHFWPHLSEGQREKLTERICGIIDHLMHIDFTSAQALFSSPDNWRERILSLLLDRLSTTRKGCIPENLSRRIESYAASNAFALEGGSPVLCHTDLHFDNLMLSPAGRLYLLDYEDVTAAPCDYMLDVFHRMTIHPFIYADEEDDPFAVKEDYRHLMEWLKKYLPALFAVPELPRRLALYEMIDALHLLERFPNHPLPLERIEMALSWK